MKHPITINAVVYDPVLVLRKDANGGPIKAAIPINSIKKPYAFVSRSIPSKSADITDRKAANEATPRANRQQYTTKARKVLKNGSAIVANPPRIIKTLDRTSGSTRGESAIPLKICYK
jgi:hypothetical protein